MADLWNERVARFAKLVGFDVMAQVLEATMTKITMAWFNTFLARGGLFVWVALVDVSLEVVFLISG